MRVLSISTLCPSPPRPGFGKFVSRQMRGLAALDEVALTMINPIGLPPFPLALREPWRSIATCPGESDTAGFPVLHPRFRSLPLIGERTNARAIAAAVLKIAAPLHARQPFDLVDAEFFFPDGPAAAIVADALDLPLVIKARGSDINYWGKRTAALPQILSAGHRAQALLAVSEAIGREMAAIGLPTERIVVHHTGLDRERFHVTPRRDARARLSLPVGMEGPLLVSVGNLIPLKGQHLVIEALCDLPEARLVCAGQGPGLRALRDLATRLGLAYRVFLPGSLPAEEVALLLSAADAMVLPSENEGLANAWIEALACGTPLVITDVGGAHEVLRDETCGRIVAREPDAIAAGVRAILADPQPQEAIAASVAHMSWERSAADLVAIWREVIAGWRQRQADAGAR